MSDVITAEKQKLQITCHCVKCGYQMIEGDEVMVSFPTLEVGVLHHAIMVAWCNGCWSNYDRNAFPKTPRTEE